MSEENKFAIYLGITTLAVVVAWFALAPPVAAGGYAPIMNTPSHVYDITEVTGSVEFVLRAGGSAQDTTLYLSNKKDNLSFNKEYDYDDEDAETNPMWMAIKVLPMGITEPIRLIPGRFIVALKNGNGGQMEKIEFPLLVGEHKRVTLLGHGFTHKSEEPIPLPTPTIAPVCNPVMVTFNELPDGVMYTYNNHDNFTKTVYVYVTEDYTACVGNQYLHGGMVVRCPEPTDVPTVVPTATPIPEPTPKRVCFETTRDLNDVASSSSISPPGIYTMLHVLPRMPTHIRYNFKTETICN